ncbi:phospholipid-transporting ATPase 1-like protein, putative [Bodo saltans]|uniref:Phospholipid-transporting ATPase n=1 Tax=Bodo saltans TaxID=75058 RepID=A0A0S4JUG6_BODSA|nr:phospholipid-transporting ATPase 1-like protein, putative [Bodo saltans]|eukprot:CUG93673.1 phospholipid-transporting ATPase 1-like protein, putative [Bodo saltans]
MPDAQPASPDVLVHMNNPEANASQMFPTNFIKTAKYTLLTFLPLNLFLQFRRISNFYFLVNMIFALIPGVSPVSPATAVLPLVFVVGVALIKDGYEDYARHRNDANANSIKAHVVRPDPSAACGYSLVDVESKDVHVGDIIEVRLGEELRADVILLSSSITESQAFIDTCNLDGETNLKNRKAIEATWGLNSVEALVGAGPVRIRTGHPDPGLLFWTGTITIGGEEHSLGLDQFMYRSCVLRNTDWVWGVVAYAGVDTKMFRNLQEKPPKMSSLDSKLNYLIVAVLIVQNIFLIVLASLAVNWNSNNDWHWYTRYYINKQTGGTLWIYRYLSYFILLSYLIPISLFVTIELCKVAQAKMMGWDEEMFEFMNGKWYGCIPNTSNLNEQLSQVKFIFSDKTGTLTENVMTYKRGDIRGNPVVADNWAASKQYLVNGGATQKAAEAYFKALILCHTIQPFDDPHNPGELIYEGASPDEVALVRCACEHGFVLKERSTRSMLVDVRGQEIRFEILATLEFTPDRKMMSMIVRDPTNGRITIYTKGADSFVIPQLSSGGGNNDVLPGMKETLIDMSVLGLRTLLVCSKDMSQSEFDAWNARFIEAGKTLQNRSQAVDTVCLEMEKDLLIVGSTAIEDKLQDQVPETLKFFLNAGVVVWMLTGDKRETAVTIAATSSLCDPQHDYVDHVDIGDYSMASEEAKTIVGDAMNLVKQHVYANDGKRTTFVIDGPALNVAMKHHFEIFLEVSQKVSSAVCCRLTPLQKANVVRMFQQATGATALAIGDGANDVSMIQEGRVGVGIVGLEGAQAALAADYAIPRFKHLRRLCAVHGRYALVRNAICTAYSFYKNALMSLPQVYFAFYTGYSGMTLYNGWILTFYNVVFTSIPPLFAGIFEKDISEEVLMNRPELFPPLAAGQYFNVPTLARWFVEAIIHSLILFWISYPTNMQLDVRERSTDGIMYGTTLMTCMVFLALAKISLHINYWTWFVAGSIIGSAIVYVLFVIIYSSFTIVFGDSSFSSTIFILFTDPKYWFYLLLFVVGFLIPIDMAILYFQKQLFPTEVDIAATEAVNGRPRATSPVSSAPQ